MPCINNIIRRFGNKTPNQTTLQRYKILAYKQEKYTFFFPPSLHFTNRDNVKSVFDSTYNKRAP
jgi:hypothetical protein